MTDGRVLRQTVRWRDVPLILLATAAWAGLCVWAVHCILDEIHQHIDQVEERIDKLEKLMEKHDRELGGSMK